MAPLTAELQNAVTLLSVLLTFCRQVAELSTASDRSGLLSRWTGLLGMLLVTGLSGFAAAEGSIQLQLYSVPAPLTLLDSVNVSLHYQINLGQGPNAALDVTAERTAVTFGVRYSGPHHSVQVSGQRRADVQAGRATTSATAVYTYVPDVPTDGVALTSATLLYVYSGSETPTYTVSSHTAGLSAGVRLNDHFTDTTTAIVSTVLLTGQPSPLWSGNVSSALVYAQDTTTAYLVPSVSVQSGQALWSVSGGAGGTLAPNLTATADASWSAGTTPSVTTAVNYALGAWQFNATAGYSGQDFSVGAGTRVSLPNDLTIGAHVALVPATLTPIYAADLSKGVGGLRFSVASSLSAPSDADATFSVQASVSSQKKPWTGNLNVYYTRGPTATTGSATGTFGYTDGAFGAQVGLGLNLSTVAAAQPILTGRAELIFSYEVTPQLALSGSARYERSVAVLAEPSYRYGVGLVYLFDHKEP